MATKQPKWLDRSWIVGPFLTLVLNEADYLAAYKHIGNTTPPGVKWAHPGACAQFPKDRDGRLCAIVSISAVEKSGPIEIAALLVHEAVHVFQEHCASIGEHSPSAEFEAYSIQCIAQALMTSYAEQVGG